MSRKLRGEKIATRSGIEIWVEKQPAKTERGRDYLLIQIRKARTDAKGRQWRVYESLSYARALDVKFVDES